MILLIKLTLAHLIGDFVLQPSSWVEEKEKKKAKSRKLYIHILIHFFLLVILCYPKLPLVTIFIISISHLIIDLAKVYNQKIKANGWLFWVDQGLHLLVLIVVAQYYQPFIEKLFDKISYHSLLLLITCLILLTKAGSVIIKQLISRWTPETEENESLKKAGSYIGMLERIFIFGFVLSGSLEAIGFLLAAKSVFRFGDLKEPGEVKLTEYILIGTLLSFGWAILVALGYQQIIPLL